MSAGNPVGGHADRGVLPDFVDGLPAVPDELVEALRLPVVDHHVHGCFSAPVTRQQFEEAINEASTDPVPDFMTQFDSQVGIAIRRWCAPLLGLPPHVTADEYWTRRRELGDEAVARALLPAAGVTRWLVDTGHAAERLTSPATLARWSGGRTQEILRLESLGESMLADEVSPQHYADEFRSRLADPGAAVVGLKSIVAYRCGFDLDWTAPTDTDVAREVAAWSGVEEDPYSRWR